ncbi:MAG: hypothetical protein AAF289_02050 [Cyanobacteria bacterium P01_A01_bin.135]
MVILDPDFPNIVWSFDYRGWQLEIDQSEEDGFVFYSVWANYVDGAAVAVPFASTRRDAIQRGKDYVDARFRARDVR